MIRRHAYLQNFFYADSLPSLGGFATRSSKIPKWFFVSADVRGGARGMRDEALRTSAWKARMLDEVEADFSLFLNTRPLVKLCWIKRWCVETPSETKNYFRSWITDQSEAVFQFSISRVLYGILSQDVIGCLQHNQSMLIGFSK